MHSNIAILSFVLATISNICLAQSAPTKSNEAGLIGAWQEGLTAKFRMIPIERRTTIPFGNIIVFGDDHTFTMYPKCGREIDKFRKLGLSSVKGSWSIAEDDELRIAFQYGEKRIDQKSRVSVQQDELRFISGSHEPQPFGRYEGPIPQLCPPPKT